MRLAERILTSLAALFALLVIALLVFAWQVGAWHILFPSSQHDTTAPTLPARLEAPTVLVFSKTNRFRHKDGIRGGLEALRSIAADQSMGIFATENGAVFNDDSLARFDVVVFLNATGDMLNADQERAFQEWLEAGGGWLGIHAAGDGSHAEWGWYMENLIGAEFTAHILGPQFQTATVRTERPEHPISRDLPLAWEAEEEWYSWASSPREKGFMVHAVVDEDTYEPVQNLLGRRTSLAMGDHPVAWSNCVGQGRSFYTALGHTAVAFEQPQFRTQLANALRWLIQGGSCSEAVDAAARQGAG